MAHKAFDAIIVGAGQAGPALAVKLAQAGKRIAIDERGLLGGTCVNVGCTPTKTLVASARVAYLTRHAADFGIESGSPFRVNYQAVKARKDAVVARSRASIEDWLRNTPNLTLISGEARFERARVLAVNGDLLEAPDIFLNVGARAAYPEIQGLEDITPLTSETILDLENLPEHLIVVGGSYVALEFAQMFARFGSKVTVVERKSRLLPREDADVAAVVKEILEDEGITVYLDAQSITADQADCGPTISFLLGGNWTKIQGDQVLLATGRRPNTDGLGLSRIGVNLDDFGFICVDDTLRTNVPGLWALGDVNGRGAFTHTSYNDYEIVAANVLNGPSRNARDRYFTAAVFIDPPLGRVGLTEAAVRESGVPALIGRIPMTRVGRAHERGETKGFMKILVHAESGQIVGAAVLGIEGDEVVNIFTAAMYAAVPYKALERATFIHPTVSELIPTLLETLRPLI